jgi:hypothetical protein
MCLYVWRGVWGGAHAGLVEHKESKEFHDFSSAASHFQSYMLLPIRRLQFGPASNGYLLILDCDPSCQSHPSIVIDFTSFY